MIGIKLEKKDIQILLNKETRLLLPIHNSSDYELGISMVGENKAKSEYIARYSKLKESDEIYIQEPFFRNNNYLSINNDLFYKYDFDNDDFINTFTEWIEDEHMSEYESRFKLKVENIDIIKQKNSYFYEIIISNL